MGHKTIDGLMRHLRRNGVEISGSRQKRQLVNTGYFHGYKGYRFFKSSHNRLPFISYEEVYATIQYDSSLKALLYSPMMYIETAVRNVALERILSKTNSESITDMYNKVVSSYKNAPANFNVDQRRKLQQNKLNLQNSIQANLARAYRKNNPKIAHFYDNGYTDVPLWALFEIMTMGDLGYLLSCLTPSVRDDISRRLGFNLSCDTNRELVYKYIYTLKDLRNAIAHNSVVFDTRFCNIHPTRAMKQCLVLEIGLPYINFKTIGDYIILMAYYMKLLGVSKTEIKGFIHKFENITKEYKKLVNAKVSDIVIHPDLTARMAILKQFL